MGEVRLGVIIGSLDPLKSLGGFVTDGYYLEGDHIHLARLHRSVVIGQAQVLIIGLAWEVKTGQHFVQVIRVVDDQIVPLRLAGEQTIHSLRIQPLLTQGFLLHLQQACVKFCF